MVAEEEAIAIATPAALKASTAIFPISVAAQQEHPARAWRFHRLVRAMLQTFAVAMD